MVTWFLSMWISNTATTIMMMTIVQALLQQFKDMNSQEVLSKKDKERADAEFSRLSKALSLTIAYSANIGGIASLTGTGTNLILYGAAQKVFEDVGLRSPITFSSWLIYGLPLSLILVFIMWLWMVAVFLRCRGGCLCCCCAPEANKKKLEKVNAMIRDEYNNLGPITYEQATVSITFVLLLVAWITRDLGSTGGWAMFFPPGDVSTTTAIRLLEPHLFVLVLCGEVRIENQKFSNKSDL
ncbi:Na(+)/citrate cotransporter-like [Physella acuta]|uniref:Na(+)/citrate cotransporter-like n=1 Tax=Physella acuta TaxID=109671 RepID=UPI0027DB6E2C|nr:Na(+)/citrate cotransporter-like [Physella acuta]